MAVLVNAWTQQNPLTATGETGVQVTRFIPACRCFLKAPDSKTAAPVNTMSAYSMKTNGITPAGWDDAGIMNATGKITYTKTIAKVQTGIDKVTRATYVQERSAGMDFMLDQLDDYLMTKLGFSASVITPGSTKQFLLGQEDVVEMAMLMAYANKLDGKEIQWYHPAAQLSVQIEETNNQVVAHVTADLIAFTPEGATKDALVSATIFA